MEFKKLSAVEAVETVGENAHVLIEENGVIKRAPKDEVGGIKIAVPAEVGQTIVVKAVDEAGVPTEWECADISGGSGIEYFVVKVLSFNDSTLTGTVDKTHEEINHAYWVERKIPILSGDGSMLNMVFDYHGGTDDDACFNFCDFNSNGEKIEITLYSVRVQGNAFAFNFSSAVL